MKFITSAIAQMINERFGNGVKIYSEIIEQGFLRPCFFICIDNGKIQRLLGGERLFCFKCRIYFYPDEQEDINGEMMEAALELLGGCENIRNKCGRLKYLGGEYKIENNRLVFEADFKTIISKEEEIILMNKLFLCQHLNRLPTGNK